MFYVIKFFSHLAAFLFSLIPIQAQAYIGPGLGLGVAAMVMGLFVAFIFLIVGLIWLPIRRITRQRKKNQESPSNPPSPKL